MFKILAGKEAIGVFPVVMEQCCHGIQLSFLFFGNIALAIKKKITFFKV